jgi:hypothetical protein
MKKRLLFALSALLLAGASALQAQSLQVTADELELTGPANLTMTSHIYISNAGGGTVSLVIERINNDLATGHSSYFCWGALCYPPTTNVSQQFMVNPGEGDTMKAYLNPTGDIGTSHVTYRVYDADNPSDSASFTITYNATTVGVDEINLDKMLSSAMPNPADQYTRVNYNVNSLNSKIVVTNLIGGIVKEIPLTDKKNSLLIPTSDLRTGIYLYSLVVDNRTIGSRKLIVTHR